jgi:hypothetical protein
MLIKVIVKVCYQALITVSKEREMFTSGTGAYLTSLTLLG